MICCGVEKDMGGSARNLRRRRGYKHIKSAFWKISEDCGALSKRSALCSSQRRQVDNSLWRRRPAQRAPGGTTYQRSEGIFTVCVMDLLGI